MNKFHCRRCKKKTVFEDGFCTECNYMMTSKELMDAFAKMEEDTFLDSVDRKDAEGKELCHKKEGG